ncbi:hypothetical protein BDZ97DRAFT_1835303 [Flammula alnicola]|nr:hypothetical protein BDZ97DRAFT_1835303 [Flammula alnicola]
MFQAHGRSLSSLEFWASIQYRGFRRHTDASIFEGSCALRRESRYSNSVG